MISYLNMLNLNKFKMKECLRMLKEFFKLFKEFYKFYKNKLFNTWYSVKTKT